MADKNGRYAFSLIEESLPTRALRVAVVVPCRNEASTIRGLLEAVAAQTRQPDEVTLVDDGSTDQTIDVVTSWAARHRSLSLRVLRAAGRGAGAAMNVGIDATAADIIVRLDGHCRPDVHYVSRCVETLATSGAGIVGGVWSIEPSAATAIAHAIAAVLSHPLGAGGAQYRQVRSGGVRAVDTVPFGAFAKELWARLEGFDESLLRNQDYDFNYRARLLGMTVLLNPAIISAYRARPTLGALARQYYAYGYWKMVMLRKHPRSLRIRQALPLALLPLLMATSAWALWSRSVAAWIALFAYPVLLLAGGAHAAAQYGAPRLALRAAAALLVLQSSWSAGAWVSIICRRH